MKIKRILYMAAGWIGIGLGAAGALLPILPTVPFLMLAAVCFARSSERLHGWFKNTKLYKNNLEDFAAGRGMTRKTKCRILTTVTLLMSLGFAVMGLQGIVMGCAVLLGVWLLHIFNFCFVVKTIR